jgi:hypothetical protein
MRGSLIQSRPPKARTLFITYSMFTSIEASTRRRSRAVAWVFKFLLSFIVKAILKKNIKNVFLLFLFLLKTSQLIQLSTVETVETVECRARRKVKKAKRRVSFRISDSQCSMLTPFCLFFIFHHIACDLVIDFIPRISNKYFRIITFVLCLTLSAYHLFLLPALFVLLLFFYTLCAAVIFCYLPITVGFFFLCALTLG